MISLSNEFIIDDDEKARIRPEGYGLIPRDMETHPVGCYASGKPMSAIPELPTIPMDEWPERIAELERKRMRLSDVRNRGNGGQRIRSLNQSRSNYCWAYTTVSGITILRARMNLPWVLLSGHYVGFMIKNGANQGGWSAHSAQWCCENGCADVEHWAENSWDRSQNTPETRANALQFKLGSQFADTEAPIYNRDLSVLQQGSLLLQMIPVCCDYNFWSHAVLGLDLIDYDKGLSARDYMRYGRRIWNSWGDEYGDAGTGILPPRRAWADNAVGICSVVHATAV